MRDSDYYWLLSSCLLKKQKWNNLANIVMEIPSYNVIMAEDNNFMKIVYIYYIDEH